MKRRLLPGLWLGLLLFLGFGSLPAPAAAQSGPAYEVIRLVNDLRASLGLPAYQIDSALMAAAQSHAEWMAIGNRWSHTGAGGSSPQDRATAAGYRGSVRENVASGTHYMPSEVVYHWGQSPGHYPTMASPQYVHIGVGYTYNGEYHIYVLLAGYPSNAAPARPANPPVDAPAAVPVEVSAPREDGAIVHVVQEGQTAWTIAAAYGVDLAVLLALNGLPDDPLIHPGDEIMIRPSGSATPPPPGPATHVVHSGETAWTIAAIYGVDLDALLALNHLGPDPLLHPGDELLIPAPTPPPTDAAPPAPTETLPPAVRAAEATPSPYPLVASEATATDTPVLTATPSPTAPPAPTLTATPPPVAETATGSSTRTIIGAIVIAVGLTVFAAMAVIELYERFVRRGY